MAAPAGNLSTNRNQSLDSEEGYQAIELAFCNFGRRSQLRGMASVLSWTLMGRMEGEAKTLVRPFQEALHSAVSSSFASAPSTLSRPKAPPDGSEVRCECVFL